MKESLVNKGLQLLASQITPARIFRGNVGTSYQTNTQLELSLDHAFAVDAVQQTADLNDLFSQEFIHRWQLFATQSQATSKQHYLLRPDFGRRLSASSKADIVAACPPAQDLQIVIGDGLSCAAIKAQVPALMPILVTGARAVGISVGRTFFVKFCRVGVLNDIGPLLRARVVILLIGERPGLATAESLSAYMAFAPNGQHTDAQRNLLSNIHGRGISHQDAATRILRLAQAMLKGQVSGVQLKETAEPAAPLPILEFRPK